MSGGDLALLVAPHAPAILPHGKDDCERAMRQTYHDLFVDDLSPDPAFSVMRYGAQDMYPPCPTRQA